MDKSNGYESIANIFIKGRGQATSGIGSSTVTSWAKTLPSNSVILDLGCGTGLPISRIFIEEGMRVYGIDASATMAKKFHENFPDMPIACEAVEDSTFFDRKFDAIIAWGLMFLLPEEAQKILIKKSANGLNSGGKFLFTSPPVVCAWNDAMTELASISLGAEKYKELILGSGLSLIDEFEDEGENHYYNSVKI